MESQCPSATAYNKKLTGFAIALLFLISCFSFTSTDAYDATDKNGNITIKWDVMTWTPDGYVVRIYQYPVSADAYDATDKNGNITIKWDVMTWTPDGYVAVVSMYNFQPNRRIKAPGWELGWTWAEKELIWSMMGGQTTEQGDCSRFKGNQPHCCKKDPTIVDLLPGTPYNQQIEHCCKGGVLSSWFHDPSNAVSSFQLSVGAAGTTNRTVKLPRNFTLKAPGPAYICGAAKIVRPTKFLTEDKKRVYQAMMTWIVTCYSKFLA